MKDLEYEIREEYKNLKVNKQLSEFIKRANNLYGCLNEGESLVLKHETRDSPGRFGVSEYIEMLVYYKVDEDGRKERALQLDVTGLLVDDELYKISD